MKKILALIILFAAAVFVPEVKAQFFFMENQLAEKPAPEFTLPLLSGSTKTLTAFRDGKKAIVFFWATWCPHCRKELEVMNRRAEEWHRKDIKIAAINLGEERGIVKKFADKFKIKLEIFLDEKSVTEEPYALIGLPTLIFVGEDGYVKAVKHSLPENIDQMFEIKSVQTK